jgi:hypothetical protein
MALTTTDRGDVFAGGTIAHVGRENLSVQARAILKASERLSESLSPISSIAIYESGDVVETLYLSQTFSNGETVVKHYTLTNGVLTAEQWRRDGGEWFEFTLTHPVNSLLWIAGHDERDAWEHRGYLNWLDEMERTNGFDS